MWILVKFERLGDRIIPHGVGGEIEWHPYLFWPSDMVEIIVKPVTTCLLFWPSDLVWIMVKPGFY